MRFSIRVSGFDKYRAEMGTATITVRRKLLSLSGEWQWTWIDGEEMALKCQTSYRRILIAGGETVAEAELDLSFLDWKSNGWVWTCGQRQLLHRQVSRRAGTWRGVLAMPRHVLKLDDQTNVAAWTGDCHDAFNGVIRRTVSNDLARLVFGIILSAYVSERHD